MEFRKYSPMSIKNYKSNLTSFFVYFEKLGITHPDRINSEMIIDYLKQFKTTNTHSGYHSAIKLYYSKVAKVGVEKFKHVERPKKEFRLPIIIDNSDIQKLFNVCKNKKHLTIMSVLYATGVRISELLSIKLSDINSKETNKTIRVIGKGNKERMVALNDILLKQLREYYLAYKPIVYLFENDLTKQPYTARSIQEFLKHYQKLANVKGIVSPHKFRHAYATTLLENGTDLRVIQKALGHESCKTTEIYTHVSKAIISKTFCPLSQIKL
jgi:integrase/recombinase XerD